MTGLATDKNTNDIVIENGSFIYIIEAGAIYPDVPNSRR